MEEDHPISNIPLYESLSEDEADVEENETHVPSTGSVKAARGKDKEKEKGGVKRNRKWSKAWRTFKFVKDEKEAREKGEELQVRCTECKYTIPYNSSFGTGNMLKHQKTCSRSRDIGQMIISSSQGSMSMQNGAFDPKLFRDMITDAVVRHNLPLSFVEYEGIREAFKYSNPRAILVSRNTLRSDILLNYKYEKKKLVAMLNNVAGRICLTSDLWTSVATDGYITITAHFITDDWVLHKKLLNFSYMPSPHTGITISEKIYNLLCEWNIESKLFSITLDNASSNDAFVGNLRTQLNLRNSLLRRGEFFHIRCCAHILNLIVQDGLKDIDASVVKIRESVKYIKGSQGRKEKFRECITQVALEKKKGLRQDVPTRWNSTYLMLDGALYYRRAFVHLQLSDSNYKHGLDEAEWDKVEGICTFLGMFYNVTRLFSGTKYPTANLYFPNVFLVQHTLNKAVEDMNCIARSMALKMQPKFDKYWSDYNMILAIAVVFDPRFKTHFVEFCYKMLYGVDCHQITDLHDTLKEMFDLYKDKIPTYTVVCDDLPGSSLQNRGIDVMKEFDALDNDLNPALEKTELDRYLEEKRMNRAIDIDVLEYWSTNHARFPNLALMARDILTIPISTVASESAFSQGGKVLDQYRSCLAHNIVESLICTRDWKFNEEVYHNYTLEQLTTDITRLDITDAHDEGV